MTTMAQQLKEKDSPYVGRYTLEQGGTDAAGAVHLLLFPNGDYVIAYFGGMLQGTWQTMANGQLELREWPGDPADFVMFGRHNPDFGSEVTLHFKGFEEGYAKIGLLGHNQEHTATALHPAFNSDANCYASAYSIKRPAAQLQTLQLAAYQEADRRNEYEQVQFSKQLLYSFPIDAPCNEYQVIYRADASKPAADFVGAIVQDTLVLFPAATGPSFGMPGHYYTGPSELSASDLKDIPDYLEAAREPMPEQLTVPDGANEEMAAYQRVAGTSEPLQEEAITLLEPLFIARC
jgi:hypothetical protein